MPPPRPERKKDEEDHPEAAEEGVDADGMGDVADDELQLSGDAVAALPAPDDPDYLEPQLTQDGEPLPVEGEETYDDADPAMAEDAALEGEADADADAGAATEAGAETATLETAVAARPAPAAAG